MVMNQLALINRKETKHTGLLRDMVNMSRQRGDAFNPGSMDDSKDFFLELLHFLPNYQSMATFKTALGKSCSACGEKSVDFKIEEICPIFQVVRF